MSATAQPFPSAPFMESPGVAKPHAGPNVAAEIQADELRKLRRLVDALRKEMQNADEVADECMKQAHRAQKAEREAVRLLRFGFYALGLVAVVSAARPRSSPRAPSRPTSTSTERPERGGRRA